MANSRFINPFIVNEFKGLNSNDDDQKLEDGEFTELVNFDVDGKSLVKRAGVDVRNIGHADFVNKYVKICGAYYKENVIAEMLVSAGAVDGKLWRTADGGTTFTEVLWGAASADFFCPKGIQYDDLFYLVTLSDTGWTYDGVGLTARGDVPSGYLGDIVLDRMFVWVPSTQTVRYSEPASFAAPWPAANSFTVGDIDLNPEVIVGMVGYKDRLVIFKQNSIWVLYMTGTPINWQLRKFIGGIGATSMHSITIAEDYIYFIGHRGVYRTNLSTVEEVSTKIGNKFRDRGSTGSTLTLYSAILGSLDNIVYWNNKIICTINIATATQFGKDLKYYVYNTLVDTWSEWVFTNAAANPYNFFAIAHTRATNLEDNKFPQGIYWGDLSSATPKFCHWKETNASIDETDEFNAYFVTKQFVFDQYQFDMKKIPRMFLAYDKGADVTFAIEYNGVASHTLSDASAGNRFTKSKGPGYVKSIQAKVTAVAANATSGACTINAFGFGIREPRPTMVGESA